MLPLPNLDERSFEQIVAEARKWIPKLMPEWTDENAHDPGITLIELFAWLTEMQAFYMNRITRQSERKFLELLGIRLTGAAPARTVVRMTAGGRRAALPRGVPLRAGDLPFETEEPLLIAPLELEKILVRNGDSTNDYTSTNGHSGVAYYAFGESPRKMNRLYLGFDQPLSPGSPMSMMVKVAGDEAWLDAAEIRGIPASSVKTEWLYYGGEEGAAWRPLELIREDTGDFARSGRIEIAVPAQMAPLVLHPAGDRVRYWVSCVLLEEGYELSPRIERISLNAVHAVQGRTLARAVYADASGRKGETIALPEYLARYGVLEVQVREEGGLWREWKRANRASEAARTAYDVTYDEEAGRTVLHFGGKAIGRSLPRGRKRVRIVMLHPTFEAGRWLGASNGLPHQRFHTGFPDILPDSLGLQVGSLLPDGSMGWEDWQRVENFDRSEADARHYLLDADTGEIVFGDNERGWIPPKSDIPSIRLWSCRTADGSRGNVKALQITEAARLADEWPDLSVINDEAATGGREAETLEEAKWRLQRDFFRPTRAATNDDYEELARRTPGLKVARVKALPLYKPGMKDYPSKQAPAQTTVVVVPQSDSPRPMPSRGFLRTVKRYLDDYRLITTELHVIAPEYVEISVHAVVVVKPQYTDRVREVLDTLHRLLRPLDDREGLGWPFGKTVHRGDIYVAINRIRGVSHVQELWLDAKGRGIRRENNGDVMLPPHGLVVSGSHDIEMVSEADR